MGKLVNSLDEIESQHSYIESIRASLDYDIDGLVFKVNDLKLQSRLGNTSNALGGQSRISFLLKR